MRRGDRVRLSPAGRAANPDLPPARPGEVIAADNGAVEVRWDGDVGSCWLKAEYIETMNERTRQ